jgi:integrase
VDARPRLFSETSLAPVFELNRLFLDALIEAAARPASEARPRAAAAATPVAIPHDGRKVGIKKKTHNNIVSTVRCAFEHGYRDTPEKFNPAAALKCFRIGKKDRLPPDPFTIQEAETIIAAIYHDWGEAQGNYEEFRFFTGMRLSEEIALQVANCDLTQGKVLVSKARVMRHDKDRTKTGEDRLVELCPRALEVLKRQLALRAKLRLAGLP